MSSPEAVLPIEGAPHPRNHAVAGVVMMLGAALLFAVNGTVSKSAIAAGLTAAPLTQVRNAGALVVLVALVVWRAPGGFRVQRHEWRLLIAYGVIAFAVVQWLYFVAISLLPVGIGTLLAFLAPVVVALWVRFGRGEPVAGTIWLALALTLTGLAIGSEAWAGAGGLDPLGILAGLALALTLSLYYLLGEAGQRHRDPLSLSMWGFLFATLAWALVRPWWTFPWSTLSATSDPPAEFIGAVPVWALVLWVVILGTVAPFLLVLGALSRIGAERAGIVGTSEPVFASLVAFLVLGETLTGWQVVGGLVVLAGVVIAERSRAA